MFGRQLKKSDGTIYSINAVQASYDTAHVTLYVNGMDVHCSLVHVPVVAVKSTVTCLMETIQTTDADIDTVISIVRAQMVEFAECSLGGGPVA